MFPRLWVQITPQILKTRSIDALEERILSILCETRLILGNLLWLVFQIRWVVWRDKSVSLTNIFSASSSDRIFLLIKYLILVN